LNSEWCLVLLRASDVLVGIIAGAVCSVIAALFEASVLTLRFFSLGRVGGGVGSKLLLIAIVGAIVGGIVGFLVGALFKTRDPHRAELVGRDPRRDPPAR
jgi:membrane protein YqaA with SNARE-associated domain